VQIVCICPADATASQNSIICQSRLLLLFWYWLTQVVLEKRLLNGFSSISVVLSDHFYQNLLDRSLSYLKLW